MKITTDTDALLVLRNTRWKAPLVWGILSLGSLWIGAVIAFSADLGLGILLLWLILTAAWFIPMALLSAEKSMLVLDATKGRAELRHRDLRGLHLHTWPLDEVQSTRVTRRYARGPAAKDPKRLLTLYVREGMDEGRHSLNNHPMDATDVLSASARVSKWMQDWRRSLDSDVSQA